ncbi:MAG: 6-phospho-3-hexuloisomerase [Alphaproteobacteria bacterium]|nr:6-phospho-3-hexuloisomerase [Alphaproteobacteria bacterium]
MTPAGHIDGLGGILEEIADVFGRAESDLVERLVDEIAGARKVLVHGAGRTGLIMRGLAMRLYHLGLQGHVVGDMTAPPIGPADLLLVNASTGDLPSGLAHLQAARRDGARTVVITAAASGAALEAADRVLRLPAQTMLDDSSGSPRSALPMGSQYELCLFLLSELAIVQLSKRLGISYLDMRKRHANIL